MNAVLLHILDRNATRESLRPNLKTVLSEAAAGHFADAANARTLVEALCEASLARDAVRVIATLLPQRAVIDWTAQSIRAAPPAARGDSEREALAIASRWLETESEADRAAAAAFAVAGHYARAGHWLCAAVGWTGGSLAPPDLEVSVPPPAALVPEAAAAALSWVAALAPDPSKALIEFVQNALRRYGHAEPVRAQGTE